MSKAILKGPVVSEKSAAAAEKGVYTFSVSPKAGKKEIAESVASQFSVEVTKVRTAALPGKPYRMGRTRHFGVAEATKKALVTLKKGQKIDIFEKSSAKKVKKDKKE